MSYLHEQQNILPNVEGREAPLSWSVIDWTPDRYSIRVSAPSDGYLLNLQNYNRNWKAYADGKWAPILRANFAFQAIFIKKGDHVIRWVYDPLAFKLWWSLFYLVFASIPVAYIISFSSPSARRTSAASA